MMQSESPRGIDEFPNVVLERTDLVREIMIAAREAEDALEEVSKPAANPDFPRFPRFPDVGGAVERVNALLATSSARCRQNPPPPADIEMVTDETGRLVYRCQHTTPHSWKLDGTPI